MNLFVIIRNTSLCILVLLTLSCASFQSSPMEHVADAFLAYKGPTVARDNFSISQQVPASSKVFENGYRESEFFVFYWPSGECVEGYTVFEKCGGRSTCRYQFEWVEGVCD